MTETLIERMVKRWSAPEARPLFRGSLIDEDGCCCAQGDVLRVCGVSDDSLRDMEQRDADRRVATELGISLAHSILLRQVNDSEDGCPQDVLAHPERILGSEAQRVLAFWRHLETLTQEQWAAAWAAAWDAARDAARRAARDAARDAARAIAWDVAWDVAWDAVWDAVWDMAGLEGWVAAEATNEIQGASRLDEFYFLPLLGINNPSELSPI